ncbi:olfactory receptor 5V1-like [Gastrophryne carolinensis]
MLSDFLNKQKVISYGGCIVQMLFFISMQGTEAFLLAAMAYDRFAAICSPLHYNNIMDKNVCLMLVMGAWIGGMSNSIIHTSITFSLSFCKSHKINHYFCDIPPMLHLSCSNTYVNELLLFTVGGVCVGFTPFLLILISYIFILAMILQLPSNKGKRKAFSTCTSHLTVVALFYGTAIFTYIRPSSTYSLQRDSVVSILYSVVTPSLNPIIYSLRNLEIQRGIRNLVCTTFH